jgi:hypothetical protein
MNRSVKQILSVGIATSLIALALAVSAQITPFSGGMPLFFEANHGQAGTPARFLARGRDFQFLISPAQAQIVLRKAAAGLATVRMQFVGANAQAQIRGEAELPGKVNYLVGNDPAQWHTGVPTFAKVRVEGIYPGISLVYYGNRQQLEYDFEIAPGANPDTIQIHFDGADAVAINAQGGLVLTLSGGEIHQPKPVFYQTVNGVRREISGGYRLVDGHTLGFVAGSYDHSLPLAIDPLLNYSTYFGGNAGEIAWAVKLDTNGYVYIAGQTFSSQVSNGVPLSTPGAYQSNFQGGTQAGDAFVAKFDNLGETLIYFTYLGGSGDDSAYALAVNGAGCAFIAGATDSTNFPVTNSIAGGVPGLPNSTNISGTLNTHVGVYPTDAFVAELDPGGSNLIYSTYLGGNSSEAAYGIALDSSDNAYVTGFTFSTNFPTTTNGPFSTGAYQNHLACTNTFYLNCNAFVAEIAHNGTNLNYSSYFGGANYDVGKGIAVDSSNFVYVAGYTFSTNFPTINSLPNFKYLNGVATNQTAGSDAFVAKFNPSFTGLVYSTFLGGTNNDMAYAIAADNNGAAYVTGWTVSTNFPNTVTITNLHNGLTNNFGFSFPIVTNAFLTKIINGVQAGTNYSAIAYSAVFGGTNRCIDIGYGVAIDTNTGNIFVVGTTSATNFPTANVPGLMRSTNSGKSDAFVIAFNTNATALLYSTYLGGKDNDYGYGIAVDTNNAYVVGQTLSANFPTLYAYQSDLDGTNDAFLTAIMLTVPLPEITTQPVSQTNGVGLEVTFFIDGTAYPPYSLQWQKGDTNFVGTNLVNGENISGATNATLTISNAQTHDSGYYWVVLTNYGGFVTSDIAALSVTIIAPAISVQPPTNQTVGVGSTATLSVTATGTPPLSYQWQFDGSPLTNGVQNGAQISGATNATLTITNVQLANTGTYLVIVTNLAGITNSATAVLTVVAAPVITVQPTNQAMAVGSTANLSVTAAGQVPLRYHWQFNGTNLVNGGRISGATDATLTITNAQTTNTGIYTVVVTNVVGSATSSNAFLNVTNIPPVITLQPTNQTVGAGTNVNLVVTATGTAPLGYQWQTNGVNLVNGGNISGATSNVLTISNVKTNNGGDYSVVVTNIAGITNSATAVLTVVAAPVIFTQPTNYQATAVGSNVTFSVYAIGQAPLSYQWQTNGVNLVNGSRISGATSNVLIINNAQTSDSGSYTVSVTNLAGSVTSSNAVLNVTNIPPAITMQPTNQAVVVGSTVTMAVTATGTALLSYQWQVNGTNLVNSGQGGQISGVTTRQLTIRNVQTNNSGSYSVIVTNLGGSVTSSNAVLTVASSPLILVQPTNQVMAVGATAILAVTAIGTTPLSYQWQFNGSPLTNGVQISGAATNNLTINNVQTANSGTYSVVITNVAGSVTSSGAYLNVTNIPPAITVQPTNQTVAVGSNVTFVVTATGTLPLSYQWWMTETNQTNQVVDGDNISGATSATLTITNVQTTNTGTYFVVITNYGGSVTSSNAVLTVGNFPPEITTQPTNQLVEAELTVTFAVTATGTPPLSYQWQLNETNLVDGTTINGSTISGSTNVTLYISSAQTNDSGDYRVIITNYWGSVTSSVAVLTVTKAPLLTVQPTNQTVRVGAIATFSIDGYATSPYFLQWLKDGTGLTNGGNISGATSATLIISDAQTNNSGTYWIVVSNAWGSVTSSNAVLTVLLSLPGFTSITAASGSVGSFILSGVGGANNGTYFVLTSSNLLVPLGQWQCIATNQFDNAGDFIFTNTVPANTPQLFYILQLP